MTGIFLIFSACLLWALDTLIRYPLLFSGLSPWSIVWFEHLLLVLMMLYWVRPLCRRQRWNGSVLLAFLVVGGLGSAISTVAFTQAFSLINPSVVILIQKLQPLVAVSLAAVLLKERIDRQFLFWLAVCLAGSLLIAASDLLPALNPDNWSGREASDLWLGYGCTLLAVFGWGAATVFGKQLSLKGFGTADLMAGRFLIGFLVLTPIAWVLSQPSAVLQLQMALPFIGETPQFNGLLLILTMVVISGLGGMGVYYLGMKRLPARTCAVAEMFFPVAAVVINWLILDQALSLLQVIGAVILLGGSTMVALTQSRPTATKAKLSADDEPVDA